MKPNYKKYRRTEREWEHFKKDAREIMISAAQSRQMLTYSDMAARMTSIVVEAHDPVLWDIIGDVAKYEEQAGRGILSALVVHKHGDMEPGQGFFELAKHFNRNLTNRTACWVEEIKRVYEIWSVKMAKRTS